MTVPDVQPIAFGVTFLQFQISIVVLFRWKEIKIGDWDSIIIVRFFVLQVPAMWRQNEARNVQLFVTEKKKKKNTEWFYNNKQTNKERTGAHNIWMSGWVAPYISTSSTWVMRLIAESSCGQSFTFGCERLPSFRLFILGLQSSFGLRSYGLNQPTHQRGVWGTVRTSNM